VSLLEKFIPTGNDERLLKVLERIAAALERIAGASERAYPLPWVVVEGKPSPPLGITVATNEALVEQEIEEETRIKSREEKLLKEYKEYIEWRERNVH
jgi:hypothetical protein